MVDAAVMVDAAEDVDVARRGREGWENLLRDGGWGVLVGEASVVGGRAWVLDLGLRGRDRTPREDNGGSVVGLRVRLVWPGRHGSRGRVEGVGPSETFG